MKVRLRRLRGLSNELGDQGRSSELLVMIHRSYSQPITFLSSCFVFFLISVLMRRNGKGSEPREVEAW